MFVLVSISPQISFIAMIEDGSEGAVDHRQWLSIKLKNEIYAILKAFLTNCNSILYKTNHQVPISVIVELQTQ